jgi:hypothetical protein
MKGSTTVIAKAVATAASTALPPRSRMRAPTRAPTGMLGGDQSAPDGRSLLRDDQPGFDHGMSGEVSI